MARFPKIDEPCPLDVQSRTCIQGYCGHCGKTVHTLDGMSNAERADVLRKATGSICVSYALTVGIGTALALSATSPVVAAEQVAAERLESPAHASQPLILGQPAANASKIRGDEPNSSPAHVSMSGGEEQSEWFDLVFVGGISDPHEAEWFDDDDQPDLPMTDE